MIGAVEMTCEDMNDLLHALLDGELDADNTRKMEAHVAGCTRCEGELRGYRRMRRAMAVPSMSFQAPAAIRCAASPWAACSRRRLPRVCCCSWCRSRRTNASSVTRYRRICGRCRVNT